MQIREIASGLQLPEGPIAIDDWPVPGLKPNHEA